MKIQPLAAKFSQEFYRRYYSQQVSHPFLSGDLFASKADACIDEVSINDSKYIEQECLKADILFCKGDLARNFLSKYSASLCSKIIIFGNSDEDFQVVDFPVPRTIKKLFIQNWEGSDSRVRVLPIGIENLRLGKNGRPKFLQSGVSRPANENEILIGPFAATHKDRSLLEKTAQNTGPWKSVKGRVSPKQYQSLVLDYGMVACPRGNGVDTHRFWETLYRNRIPIVSRGGWSKNISVLDIPFIEIDDWSTKSLKNAVGKAQKIQFDARQIPSLWWNYWEYEFKQILN